MFVVQRPQIHRLFFEGGGFGFKLSVDNNRNFAYNKKVVKIT